MGDGELQEGSVWEAFMYLGYHKLKNIIPVIDYNNQQSFGSVDSTLGLEPLGKKFSSFGLNPINIDGHCHSSLQQIYQNDSFDIPPVYILNTRKGYPVDFMLDNHIWHYKSPDNDQLEAIISQLEAK